jgi:outer membrane protein OmpU
MKKILLASTILVGTAGFAAAETANFTFSGEAGVGFAYATDGVTEVSTPTISAEFTAGMMTMTDGGLEAGASVTVSAGGRSIETDNTDTAFGTVSDDGFDISGAEVYLSGDWGKVTASYDGNVAGVLADDELAFAYSNTWGDFTVYAEYLWIDGADNDEAVLKGTYAFGDYSVYAAANFLEPVTGWELDSIDFGGAAAMSGFSLAVDMNYNLITDNLTWKATAGYATGPYSAEVWVEDDDTLNDFDYGASAAYDMGGGVSLNAGYIHDNDWAFGGVDMVTAGVSMSF